MELNLKGKIALITGGSRGLGFACAQTLMKEGVRIAIVSRQQSSVDKAIARLPGAFGIAADLIQEDTAAETVARVESELGPIDILVNSAGAAKRTPLDELTPAHWRGAMNAKFFTYINVTDPVIKLMAKRQAGVIINIIGIGGKEASTTHLAGGSANAALMLATTGLAAAYAKNGIRVVGLNPGHTWTERVDEGMEAEARHSQITKAEAINRLVQRIPMGRLGKPEEVANVVAFLASEKASYVTGVNISMDGGACAIIV